MYTLVAPSGECLQGDGRCADRIVNNFSAVALTAYLPVLNLLLVVLGLRAMMYIALSCVSAVVSDLLLIFLFFFLAYLWLLYFVAFCS